MPRKCLLTWRLLLQEVYFVAKINSKVIFNLKNRRDLSFNFLYACAMLTTIEVLLCFAECKGSIFSLPSMETQCFGWVQLHQLILNLYPLLEIHEKPFVTTGFLVLWFYNEIESVSLFPCWLLWSRTCCVSQVGTYCSIRLFLSKRRMPPAGLYIFHLARKRNSSKMTVFYFSPFFFFFFFKLLKSFSVFLCSLLASCNISGSHEVKIQTPLTTHYGFDLWTTFQNIITTIIRLKYSALAIRCRVLHINCRHNNHIKF